ncbi:MAG: hypothetical protein ACSLEZ_06700 [Thiobacillus sp.]
MSTPPSPAGSHAPDTPSKEETLAAHAKRSLLTKIRSRITAFLDKGIALLQRLRKQTAGAQASNEDEDKAGAGRDRPSERRGSAAPPEAATTETPKPTRRLRAILIYASVLLVGGLGGGALAYYQFQKQLGPQLEERLRLEAALDEKTRPSTETLNAFEKEQIARIEAEKKLASAFAEFAESTADSYSQLESLLGQQFAENRRMETVLAENAKSSAETQQALEEAQARRVEAEKKLALSLTQSSTGEQQPPSAAERRLARQLAREEARAQRKALASSRTDSSKTRPIKTGNCTLDTKNVDSLQNCLDDFNQ